MCHFFVHKRHPLSLLTNWILTSEKLIAHSHGLNLALLLRFNAAPLQRGPRMGSFVTESAYRAGKGERLGEIASAVQGVTDTLAQIATAVDEQASTADEVSGNIQQVDQAAVRLLEGARAVNLAADTLSQGSKALSANTGRFQLN